MQAAEHSVNLAGCTQSAMHFGFTRYHNVCAGTVTDVPWGAVDWMLGGVLGVVLLGMGATFLGIGVMMIRDR